METITDFRIELDQKPFKVTTISLYPDGLKRPSRIDTLDTISEVLESVREQTMRV